MNIKLFEPIIFSNAFKMVYTLSLVRASAYMLVDLSKDHSNGMEKF